MVIPKEKLSEVGAALPSSCSGDAKFLVPLQKIGTVKQAHLHCRNSSLSFWQNACR